MSDDAEDSDRRKMNIDRIRGAYTGRNKSTAYKDLVWTVATASNYDLDMAGQTRETLDQIESNLIELNSNKRSIVSAQIYVADINQKSEMDTIWRQWIGDDCAHWPQRACVGVNLEGMTLVEITVTAIRESAGQP